MDLPTGSPLTHYTLETPWPVALGLLAVGLVILQVAVNRQNRRILLGGVIILLLVPILIVAAALVETPSETLRRRTLEFVDAAVNGQIRVAADYLDDDVKVVFGVDDVGWTQEGLLLQIRAVPVVVRANSVREVHAAAETGTSGTTVFVQTTTPSGGYPTPNQWRFQWTRAGPDDVWRISRLTWERWGRDTVPSIEMLPRIPGP